MGAEFQTAHIRASSPDELPEKFRALIKRAQYDYGHAGYSGTLAEKDDFELQPGLWTEVEAEAHASENNDKWGEAFVYLIKEDEHSLSYLVAGWCSS